MTLLLELPSCNDRKETSVVIAGVIGGVVLIVLATVIVVLVLMRFGCIRRTQCIVSTTEEDVISV